MSSLRCEPLQFILGALAVGLFASHAAAKPDVSQLRPGPIVIQASPITKFSRVGPEPTGKLKFIGGLVLTSPEESFGGWSGLVVDDEAKSFVAISDTGVWLTGKIDYERERPSGIADARLGPLLARDGKPIRRDIDRDSEAIALEKGSLGHGSVLISFERRPRIVRYGLDAGGITAEQGRLDLPPGTRRMRSNQGLEATTVIKGGPYRGSVIAFSERLYDSDRNHTGWLWTARGTKTIHLKNVGDFDITDIASMDDGTLFVLERRFRWSEGVKMRLVRLRPDQLGPDHLAEGETLIEADLDSEIDNMEGLAATRLKDGRILLTMISDDNFNHLLQRTVLLQFALKPDTEARKGESN